MRGLRSEEFLKFIERSENFRGAAEEPAADLLDWYAADQVHRDSQPMRECQFTLRTCAATSVLVPIADKSVTAMFDQIKIVSNDLLHGPAEAREIFGFPRAKLTRLTLGHFF